MPSSISHSAKATSKSICKNNSLSLSRWGSCGRNISSKLHSRSTSLPEAMRSQRHVKFSLSERISGRGAKIYILDSYQSSLYRLTLERDHLDHVTLCGGLLAFLLAFQCCPDKWTSFSISYVLLLETLLFKIIVMADHFQDFVFTLPLQSNIF